MKNNQNGSLASRIVVTPLDGPDGSGAKRLESLLAETGEAGAALAEVLAQNPQASELLKGTLAGSPYLSRLLVRDPARAARILAEVPEEQIAVATAAVETAMAAAPDIVTAKRALRNFKNEVALLTALADLGGVWPVMTVTRVLSEAADTAVSLSVRFLFRLASQKGQWASPDLERPELSSGYFILAMGKHGAFELNYSSDIDLIVFFDRERSRLTGDGDLQTFFVKLTRDLVLLLEDRTPDGYVFRVDLRLRPDAGATQIALSTAGAHGYYETVGQNWERAAMIKARTIAGDIDAGDEFMHELAPFVWRKYLDFAAIADVHAMKRQIHAHREIGDISVLGQNLKLGRGGIREIEFFAQTQQLIAGGRQADLRERTTLGALEALERRGWVKPKVGDELEAAYLYLRGLEHRVQMVNDEQTHDMPSSKPVLEEFARFAGYADAAALSADLISTLKTVERHYAGLFEDAPALAEEGSNLVFAGATDDPATLSELARMGYSQPAQVLSIVRGWHHGRTPAVRSPRARERLTEVQPLLIAALADTVDPDAAIASFDRFLLELPSGVQLFSLLKAQPKLIRLLADIMGSAPRLARILSRRRRLLDAVLDPQVRESEFDADAIDALLNDAFADARGSGRGDPMQEILDTARVIGREQSFLVGVRILTGSITAAEAGVAYATIAERLISALMREVTREMEEDSGHVQGGGAVVIALGKLGGREMTASSDVDLILLYDYAPTADQSDGAKPLAPGHYYTRLTQRLITAISAQTAEGALYEADMRLRPSGQKGPVATKLSSFQSYQQTEAWTWEHMALTRARVIAGSAGLGEVVREGIRSVLEMPRDRAKIAADVRDMRTRIEADKGSKDIWNLKQVRGGLVDLEFIAQYLQLVHAAAHPQILDQTTLISLARAREAGLLSDADHLLLSETGQLLHDLTQILRLSFDGQFDPSTAPKGVKALLARAGKTETFEELQIKLEQGLGRVHEAFERLII